MRVRISRDARLAAKRPPLKRCERAAKHQARLGQLVESPVSDTGCSGFESQVEHVGWSRGSLPGP